MIMAVVLAALMIVAAVAYVKIGGGGSLIGAPATPVDMSACAEGDQCIVVDTDCGFCCDYVAINARYEEAHDTAFNRRCGRYDGEFCNCFDLASYPACIAGTCQLVKWPDERSPGDPQ